MTTRTPQQKLSKTFNLTVDPSSPSFVITRELDAPRKLVFEAMTKPEHVRQWWGMCTMTMVTCEMDVRVGGKWRFVLRDERGDHGFSGVYKEIVPGERVVQTFVYDPYPDAEATETMVFTEKNGRTTLTVTVVHKTMEARDGHVGSGMEGGARETYDRLEAFLASRA